MVTAVQIVLKETAPIFMKTWKERRVCPVCGKEFTAKINTWRKDPSHAHFCSKRCRLRQNDKTLTNRVTNEEFVDMMNNCMGTLRKATRYQLTLSVHDNSMGYEDVMQECLVTLWLMMCREKRAGRETRLYHDGYLFTILRKSLKHSKAWIKRNVHDEEVVIDEYSNGIEEFVVTDFTRDKIIDLRNILNEIYDLSKHNRNVAMALERAVNYRVMQDREMGAKLRERHGITSSQHWNIIKWGVEYIFYCMPELIRDYINIADTNETFRFHPNHDWKRLRTRDVSQMTRKELDTYFATERQCCICGKWFTPTAQQKGKDKVVCSKKCSKKLDAERSKAWLKAKKEREAQCKSQP